MARVMERIAAGMAAVLVCASGCGRTGVSSPATTGPDRAVTGASSALSTLPAVPASTSGAPATTPAPPPATQAVPAAGSCHVRGSGLYVLPDPTCTPGVTNPAVTQADIDQTICRSGWTATVRPPESYTEPLKYQQMAAYEESGSAGNYEEDHLISLELGGSPTSPQNLWPEPGGSPNPKDSVENAAKRAVCDGQMTLAAAQQAIATNWISLGQQLGVTQQQTPTTQQAPTQQAPSVQGGTCTASASYSSRYGDWDVYVHSNQPSQAVTVTASGGATATYHTNSSGYADVYLHAPQSASGQSVTVTVGSATCSTTL
ncbi:MAG TPA: hypothetical protein VFH58_10585 [Acidimicrobiales bacterium]|nr:hypothetical protein [Acidimicrobiales bacterium]